MTLVEQKQTRTFQTRITVTEKEDKALSAYAFLMSNVIRFLFAAAMAGKKLTDLKTSFLKRFEITARQFNACRVETEGKIASVRQLNTQRIESLKRLIEKLEKQLQGKRLSACRKYWTRIRLKRVQKKLKCLESDQKKGKVQLCFGTRKLFRSQFTGELSYEEWKQKWNAKRNSEFFALGSKDETTGNQTCTATIADDGSLTLRLRLPNALVSGHSKYLEFKNLRFDYGHDTIVTALQECQLRSDLARSKEATYKEHGQAICWRFVRDKKGWRVFASTALPEPKWVTKVQLGAIGVDINVDHLAVVEIDRFGNRVQARSVPCCTYGKTQDQAQAIIGNACAQVVAMAQESCKPIVIERLDFARKKEDLKKQNSSYSRMLSSFAYSKILQTIRSRSYHMGVRVNVVNPAYTSMIGKIKYAKKQGLSVHHAAAFCIARRNMRFSEKLPSTSSVPDGKGGHVAFSVPVRNRKKNEWAYFGEVLRKFQAALAEHFRVTICQSSDPPNRRSVRWKSSKIVGEIPAREPLATLLG